ncbi:calmin-like [Acipenser ruthenus]|uniref:calmin-like n=1 Tax=Acipenser ruthenus TaxID=7906 RepID=UPI00274164BA|nr:calmin-like [Acipenser ruthenus]
MAGHEWNDWFEREELIGQISDIRVQNLQVERETVQKRTFTRWINLHLEKCKPPLEVTDLFQDVQDGKILMILLEELSGCKLLHEFKPSSHRIFRLNNIAKVLKFLEERHVKLVSIDAADVADGNSSIVLGLIWNIILFFQIKELTGNIKNRVLSSSSLSSLQNSTDSDTSHPSTPTEERLLSVSLKGQRRAIKTLLQWVQRRTRKYGVAVQDFGKSWKSGLAFLAIIKAIDPSLVDIKKGLENTAGENLEDAFRIAYYNLGIPRLLEPEDITIASPDEQSIMTYVSQFLEHFPELEEDEVSDVIEKSVSPVKDNSPVNGLHQNGDQPYVARNDWVQPPPKIFISSVRDKPEQMSPPAYETLNDRHNQPWNSEEDSSDSISSHTEPTAYPQLPLELRVGVSCVVQSANSAQPSFVGDTPDSLYEFISEEFDGKIQENENRSQLNGSQLPVVQKGELLINGELVETDKDTEEPGRTSPLQGHAREDYIFEDLFIDESTFSEISEASFKVKSKLPSEEEDAYKYILDLPEQENAQEVSSELSGEEEKVATVKKAPNTSESALEKSEPHNALEEISTVEHRSNALTIPSKCNDAPSEENPEAMQKIDSIALESKPASEEPSDKKLCPVNGSQAQGVSQSPVSVTPLHLVYYPHYNVAISDIIEAFSPPVTEGTEHLQVTSSSWDVVSNVKGDIQPCSELQGNTSQAVPSATLNQMNGGNQEYLEDSTKVEENTAMLSYSDAQVITRTDQGVDQESSFNSSSRHIHEEQVEELVLEEGEEEQSVQLNAKPEIKGNLEVVEHLVEGMMPTVKETDLGEECNDIKDGRESSDSKSGISVLTEGRNDDLENTEHTEIIRRNNVHSEDSITEIHICPKLSHRKQTMSNQMKENGSENDHLISSNISGEYQGQESSAVKAARNSEDPSNGTTPGIYLLIFLWILVYCLIIIPQLNYD